MVSYIWAKHYRQHKKALNAFYLLVVEQVGVKCMLILYNNILKRLKYFAQQNPLKFGGFQQASIKICRHLDSPSVSKTKTLFSGFTTKKIWAA